MNCEIVSIKVEDSDDEVSQSTKSSTKIKVARSKKTNAQKCKEYRQRKKFGYTRIPKNRAQRFESENDLLLEIKKPNTDSQKCKQYRLRKRLEVTVPKICEQKSDECEKDLLQEIKKAKTDAQRSKEYRERQKIKKQIELQQNNAENLKRKSTKTPAEYMREYRRKVKLRKQGIQLNALPAKDYSDSLTMHEQNNAAGTQIKTKIQEEKLICDTKSVMIQIEVKKEPDYDEPSETDLYGNHVIKEERVTTGPEVFLKYVGSEDHNLQYPVLPIREKYNAVGTQSTIKIKQEKLICDDNSEMIEIEVKREPDCYMKSETDLYENHVIKEEMVTGPEVFHKYTNSLDVAQPTDQILAIQNIKTESDPQEETSQENVTKHIITIKIEKENHLADIETTDTVENQNTCSDSKKDLTKIFFCNVCGEQFTKQYLLSQHLESHEKKKQNIYINCKECSYKALTRDTLERHMKFLHDTNRRFICNVCGYRYMEQHHLNTHTKTVHADKDKYQCDECGYKTNERCKIERHIRVHSKNKLYSCTECNYKSRYKHNVTSHKKKHSGERQFSCSVCGFKCIQKGHLKRHVKIHTGEKLFACTVCGYKCIQKCNLTRHMKIHHTV